MLNKAFRPWVLSAVLVSAALFVGCEGDTLSGTEIYSGKLLVLSETNFHLTPIGSETSVVPHNGAAEVEFTYSNFHDENDMIRSAGATLVLSQGGKRFQYDLTDVTGLYGTSRFISAENSGQVYPMKVTRGLPVETTEYPDTVITEERCGKPCEIGDSLCFEEYREITTRTHYYEISLHIDWGSAGSTPDHFYPVAKFDGVNEYTDTETTRGECR